jgi:hypothetical protein
MMSSYFLLAAVGLFILFIGFIVGFQIAKHYRLKEFADRIKSMEDYYSNKGK